HRDVAHQETVLALQFLRAEVVTHLCDLSERHLRTGGRGDEDSFQIVEALPQFTRIANANGVALAPFDGVHQVFATDGDLDDVLHVPDVDAKTCGCFPVDLKLDVWFTDDTVGDDIRCSRHLAENLFDLQADALDLPQVRAIDFYAHHG